MKSIKPRIEMAFPQPRIRPLKKEVISKLALGLTLHEFYRLLANHYQPPSEALAYNFAALKSKNCEFQEVNQLIIRETSHFEVVCPHALLRIYPSSSIKNHPEYCIGNLKEFLGKFQERIVVRAFAKEQGGHYFRFYLRNCFES